MALELTTYPTNREDAAEDLWSSLMGSKFRNGVYKAWLFDFEVYADSTGMQVKVKAGQALIGGFDAEMSTTQTLALDSSGSSPRIDRVVLRLDRTDPSTIYLDVLTGTPASSPSVPALTNTSTITEIGLAQVRVDALVSTITPAKITDERTYVATRGHGTGTPGTINGTTGGVGSSPFSAPVDHWHAIDVTAVQRLLIPAGTIWSMAYGSTTPSGWLPCDGRLVGRGSYPSLFTALGTVWGAGDGSSTFGIPDLRNYILRGAGGNQSVGQSRGADTSSALIAHSHNGPNGIQFVVGEIATSTVFANTGPLADHTWDITASAETEVAGVGSSFSIEQASKGVAFIIKAH